MGIYLKRFEHESVRVGTLREEEKLRMDLDTSKLSVIWIACRFDDDPDSKLYQLQGFAPDEQSAIALCRGSEYFYFGPVPFNCALPHNRGGRTTMTLTLFILKLFVILLQSSGGITLERVAYWLGLLVLGGASYYGFRGKKMEAISKTDTLTISSQQTLLNTRDRELMDLKGLSQTQEARIKTLSDELKNTTEGAAALKTEYMALASLDVSALLNFAAVKRELEMTQMEKAEAITENTTLRRQLAQLERQLRAVEEGGSTKEGTNVSV
jgi:hypothetical protein